jgi:hypothetical protein
VLAWSSGFHAALEDDGEPMKKAKIRIASQIVGVAALALGASAGTASAEQRQLVVTLADGRQVPVTVDVAPGTPVDSIQLGDFGSPIVSVAEVPGTPTSTATTPSPTTSTPTPTTPSTTAKALTTPTTVPTTTVPTTPTNPSTTPKKPPTATTPTTTTTTPATGGVVKPKTKGKAKREGSAVAVDKKPKKGAGGGNGAVTDTIEPTTTTPQSTTTGNGGNASADSGAQPTQATPGFTVTPSLTPTTSVPNFFIEQFQIPPFLLPIYQAAGTQFDIPWQVLAAINEIETDYGRNLSVSSAGALGWMQFMPSSWEQYGMDANRDGVKDPYNPVDAIFAAARYLRAAGGDKDIDKAIFAYNHADWYVQSVLLRARVIGGMPADLVGSLTGLTQAQFPVAATATYADSLDAKAASKQVTTGANAANTVEGDPQRRSINVFAKRGAPVIAVNDGRIVKIGRSPTLGRYAVLQDVYGNRYSYDHLGSLATRYPVPKTTSNAKAAAVGTELELPRRDAKPTKSATAGTQRAPKTTTKRTKKTAAKKTQATKKAVGKAGSAAASSAAVSKERLFANPGRPQAYKAGGKRQIAAIGERVSTFKGYFSQPLAANPKDYVLKPLRAGSSVIAGTILGRIGKTDAKLAPHVGFAVRPSGRGAPLVDPKPILDGWKLLESTAVYRANGSGTSLFRSSAQSASTGQVLLMSKEQLQQRVLNDPNLDIYECGRQDIQRGIIDRRVLATLEFLSTSGLKLQISALECGHGYLTTSGNVSEHSSGDAVDISAVNGIPITGHQGEGSITDLTIRRLLTLQGTMKPHQIISLMTYPGTDNTLSLPDHFNHIHIGFHPLDATNVGAQVQAILKPAQWTKLIDQISTIKNPTVPTSPSKYAIKDAKKAGN